MSEALKQALLASWEPEPQLLAGRLHMARGRFQLAHEQGQSAARLVEQINDARSDTFLQRYLADLAVWQGDYDIARSVAVKALSHAPIPKITWSRSAYALPAFVLQRTPLEQARDRRGRASEPRDLHATGQQLVRRPSVAWPASR